MRHSALALIWITGLLAPASAATPGRTVFYLDSERLITLEFQITVGGKPLEEAWQETLDEQFSRADQDKDGLIAGQERDLLPNPSLLRFFRQSYTFRAPPESLGRNEYRQYIEKKLEFAPFQVVNQQAPNLNTRRLVFSGMQNDPNQAAKILFSRLDGDQDGGLSKAEMDEAARSLAKLDFDQDETISSAELVPQNLNMYFASPSRAQAAPNQFPFLSLDGNSTLRNIAQQLTNKYDAKDKDNALSQSELGVSEKVFGEHDIDGNGKWDFDEIQQFARSPKADVIVKLRLGKLDQPDRPRIEFEHGAELNSDVKSAIGSLNLKSVQMEFSASTGRNRKVEDGLKSQFRSIDRDNNGYLEKEELQQFGDANSIFQELDKDGDGKLFEKELLSAVLPLAELMAGQMRLLISDRGRDLFRILDSNGDNRLSNREFRAMPDRAQLWDKDRDRRITAEEIPQQYRLVASPNSVNFLNQLNGVVVASPAGMAVPRAALSREGPIWFQRMDRNSDGDLSPREFLGTGDEFKKLDQDQDGLIDPREALSAAGK